MAEAGMRYSFLVAAAPAIRLSRSVI